MLGVKPAAKIAGSYDVVNNTGCTSRRRHYICGNGWLGRRSIGLPERYFLYVGRLAPEKNVKGLLASVDRTYRRGRRERGR